MHIVINLDNGFAHDYHVDLSSFRSYLDFFNTKTSPTMADACFTARATTCEHVRSSITKLTLLTNASGQYNHTLMPLPSLPASAASSVRPTTPVTRAMEWTNSAWLPTHHPHQIHHGRHRQDRTRRSQTTGHRCEYSQLKRHHHCTGHHNTI